MNFKRILMVLVLLFATVYYLGRIGIFFVAGTGEMAFEKPQTDLVENVVDASFLMIGVLGLLFLPGVYLGRAWGFWGTVALSIYTIAFDVWAYLFVQASAIAGVVPAAIIMGYLILFRNDLLGKRSPTA